MTKLHLRNNYGTYVYTCLFFVWAVNRSLSQDDLDIFFTTNDPSKGIVLAGYAIRTALAHLMLPIFNQPSTTILIQMDSKELIK